MGLRNRMAILAETFAHDRFYKRVHAANVFVEEILEYTNIHGREMQRINAQADVRTASRLQQQTGAIENGIQFEMVPLEEPLDLLSYKYIPYTTPTGDTEFARSSEIVTIVGVLNYNRFEATKRATVPTAYVFPAELSQVAKTLIEHGIDVAVLEQNTRFEGEVFSVTGIETQSFVQNQHRNTLLQGQIRPASRQFSAGDYYVALDNRLANLIFYLLEAQSDDGLAYWNFFDSYLQSALAQNPGDAAVVDFPVFKVLSIAAPPN